MGAVKVWLFFHKGWSLGKKPGCFRLGPLYKLWAILSLLRLVIPIYLWILITGSMQKTEKFLVLLLISLEKFNNLTTQSNSLII